MLRDEPPWSQVKQAKPKENTTSILNLTLKASRVAAVFNSGFSVFSSVRELDSERENVSSLSTQYSTVKYIEISNNTNHLYNKF